MCAFLCIHGGQRTTSHVAYLPTCLRQAFLFVDIVFKLSGL